MIDILIGHNITTNITNLLEIKFKHEQWRVRPIIIVRKIQIFCVGWCGGVCVSMLCVNQMIPFTLKCLSFHFSYL